MKYAVVQIKGTQYKVTEDQELLVDKLNNETPKAELLLMVNDDTVTVGKPFLAGSVDISILEPEVKGKKLVIQKFKAKSRYRRKTGFRPVYSKIKIGKISMKKKADSEIL